MASEPDYWIAILDSAGLVLGFQHLTTGFKKGAEPDSDERLWSTFTLTLRAAHGATSQAILRVWEPSPGNTAWGRNGFVRFSWPDYRPIEWESDVFHSLNPSFNVIRYWNWDTRSGSAVDAGYAFRYVIPRLALDEAFSAELWKYADWSSCASRLEANNAERLLGERFSPHVLTVVLSERAELFVDLHVAEQQPPSKRASIEVCYSGAIARSALTVSTPPRPPCIRFSLDGSRISGTGHVEKAPEASRYKLQLPPDELNDEFGDFGITLILRDSERRQSLLSSKYDFKTPSRLGHVLTFSSERVSCKLEGGSLVPRFRPVDPREPLIDQLR